MQTITLNVEDNKVDSVMTLLQELKENLIDSYSLSSSNDKNLKLDPYFYERKERLAKLREDIKTKKMPMYDFDNSMDELMQELEA